MAPQVSPPMTLVNVPQGKNGWRAEIGANALSTKRFGTRRLRAAGQPYAPVRRIHMNGRVYDPKVGRFLSVDPVFQFPENTQSLNPYTYVLNSSLSLTDPTGFKSDGSICDDHPSACGDVNGGADALAKSQGKENSSDASKTGLPSNSLKHKADSSTDSSSLGAPSTVGQDTAASASSTQPDSTVSAGAPSVAAASQPASSGGVTRHVVYVNPNTGNTIWVEVDGNAPSTFVGDVQAVIDDAATKGSAALSDSTSKRDVVIAFSKGRAEYKGTPDSETEHKITFDTRVGLVVKGLGGKQTGQSPAVGLIHEIGHAAQIDTLGEAQLLSLRYVQDRRFTTAGETHNVQTYERPYAKSFGRAGVRDSYRNRGDEVPIGFGRSMFDRP